jgi:hypothetical protein
MTTIVKQSNFSNATPSSTPILRIGPTPNPTVPAIVAQQIAKINLTGNIQTLSKMMRFTTRQVETITEKGTITSVLVRGIRATITTGLRTMMMTTTTTSATALNLAQGI